jgi:thiosulfate/3-mercaptopyruvate sulfurtransferase
MGISDDSRIVIYYSKADFFPAVARIVFTLDYVGLGGQTSILNGGMAAWTRAGKALTKEASPAATPGNLSDRPAKKLVAEADFVKSVSSRPNHRLVDARAAAFFDGTRPTFEKSGHIPGAVNIPFNEILDDSQAFDKERVAELFRKAGIGKDDTVVAYCHIGLQATAVIFGARVLGHPVLLYDGAFEDWANNNRGPVEK